MSSLIWLQGSTQNLTITDSLPLHSDITVIWYRQFVNGSIQQLNNQGPQIFIYPVYKMLPHVYFYKLLDKNNNNDTILTSNVTNTIHIHCKYTKNVMYICICTYMCICICVWYMYYIHMCKCVLFVYNRRS